MTSEELVEKAARLMCDDDPDDILCYNAGEPKERWKLELEPARAVVALVIEEAANVADSIRKGELALQCAVDPAQDRASFNHHRAAQMTSSDIAAAIRALAPTEGEMG